MLINVVKRTYQSVLIVLSLAGLLIGCKHQPALENSEGAIERRTMKTSEATMLNKTPTPHSGLLGAWKTINIQGVDVSDSTAMMNFQSAGELIGDYGCRGYMTSYKKNQDRLNIGPVAMVKMMCPDEAGYKAQMAFMKAIDHVERYSIKDNFLYLSDKEGQAVMILKWMASE